MDRAGRMLSYEDALARLLSACGQALPTEVPLAEAAGLTLAEDLTATLTQPPFAASAMDGYAVRWADMPGPWRVVGESAAGRGFAGRVGTGEAARIFTGAPVPEGADTVIVQEDVRREGDTLALTGEGPPHEGAHIRAAGKDFRAGQRLIAAGTRLSPQHLGLAAAAGHGNVAVRRPRVAIIATGDELVPPGEAPRAGQIVSSNGVMLGALLRAAGAEVRDLGIFPDDLDAIGKGLAAAKDADLVVTVGGASVGDHDLVQKALTDAGAAIDFWKVAIKPGKPLIAGSMGGARVLGLPGNPVSAFVCAALFALPMIARMAGRADAQPAVTARLLDPLPANGNRRDHLRARLSAEGVRAFTAQDSSMLGVLADANALIIRPVDAPAAEVGSEVAVLVLDRILLAP
ncbi:gephyrin-like molybdotransferase Glp [Sphingosinicella soli]|uniref:Molybdopterin molybdenumtransferase n=1 Tax=Sphingosinicella soli TaxID=333708 RepID=A0A7W7AZX3_9SPHN|nr:gephyrin-like molybdotransferase Glp [Sphingosinicella soli]MBB4630467.1 molybdopterin molybdotransferase [Sphingosinicella soli]